MGKKIVIPDKFEKLNEVFMFISNENNRVYNQAIQHSFIETWIGNKNLQLKTKVLTLLYNIYNTQSQANIESGANFFKRIHNNSEYYNSFFDFCKFLSGDPNLAKEKANFKFAFDHLKEFKGWGEKTASLFLKVIYEIHNGRFIEYAFWNDTPNRENADRLFLPVDQVILFIFKEIYGMNLDFAKINDLLYKKYKKPEEILIWDDLWFWGYISQFSYKENKKHKRKFTNFNEAKYWTLLGSNKDADIISSTKAKLIEFINIVQAN